MVLALAEDEPELLHCMEQGADDYLIMPSVGQDVIRKVRGLLLLQDAIGRHDSLTGMPGTLAVKREINHKLARRETIAACYIGPTNSTVSTRDTRTPGSGTDELVRNVAGLVSKIADEIESYEPFAAYVGAAHFVVVLNIDGYDTFCKQLIEKFDREIAHAGHAITPSRPSAGSAMPKIAIGVAHNQYRAFTSADKMFQVLAEVHRKAQESATSSYFVDRRRVDR
jgi:GGDEF domain-containing protein